MLVSTFKWSFGLFGCNLLGKEPKIGIYRVKKKEIKNILQEIPRSQWVKETIVNCNAYILSLTGQLTLLCNFLWVWHLVSFYFAVNLTTTCPQGYYCPLGSVRPIQCPWGTYQPQVGQSSLRACKQCPDFMLNLSKPDPFYTPVANITDCVKGNPPTKFVEGMKN